eukprot:gene564-604_t
MAAPLSPKKSFSEALSTTNRKIESISLVWEDLNFSIRAKDTVKSNFFRPVYKNKRILRNLYGRASSGELLAIMGPTGCGKTSLMNVLAARVADISAANAKLTGAILVNGLPRDDEAFRRISAYVLQDDRLYPHLTVNETLMISAHFYLPDFVTDNQKKELVGSVISELGLGKTVDTIIGDEKVRGISGGERKRANIAVQLISDPSILFLDEPTSGLDSFQAQAVMEAMKNMAMNGRLVITVIHQPRSSIYDMFDKLLLLSEGRAIYHGDAAAASAYFSGQGFSMTKFFNPADYFLDLLSPDTRTKELETESFSRIELLAQKWNEKLDLKEYHSLKVSNNQEISVDTIPIRNKLTVQRYFRNFTLLFWRAFTELIRDRFTIFIKCALTTFFACIVGAMYSSNGNDQSSIRDREGLLFVITINQSFNNVIGVLNSFPKEKIIVSRERSTGAYDTLSYFTAKFIAETPINVFPSFVYGCIVYWIVGLNSATFGYFILILLLLAATAISLGLAVSALSPNVDVANAMGIPSVIVALIFAGFYINLDSLPVVAEWIPYISFMRWAFQSFCINEFKGQTFSCSAAASGSQCLPDGTAVLESLSFNDQTIHGSTLGLGVMLLFFFFSAIVVLEVNRLKFMKLGHVGGNMKNFDDNEASEPSQKTKMVLEINSERLSP